MEKRSRVAYIAPTMEYVKLCERIPRLSLRTPIVEALILAMGLYQHLRVEVVQEALLEELETFHSRDYLDALNNPPADLQELEDYGLVDDCAPFSGMLKYALLTAGGALNAARAVASGATLRAIWWSGGRHHAKWSSASGFCYVNDAVIACNHLSANLGRVLYVDLDAHHGDGVEEAFITTDEVMTVSFHAFSRGFFPGTGGFPAEEGVVGRGYSLNMPLLPNTGDEVFVPLIQKATEAVKKVYNPKAVVLVAGPDCLSGDPLGELRVSVQGLTRAVRRILDWELPTVLLGGGGYSQANTARALACITAAAASVEIPEQVPENHFFEIYGPDFTFNHYVRMTQRAKTEDTHLKRLDGILSKTVKHLLQDKSSSSSCLETS